MPVLLLNIRPMRILTLIALCFAILLQPALGEDSSLVAAATGQPSLADTFRQRNPKTLAVLEADFPGDYRDLLAHLATIESTGQSQMVQLNASFDALGQIRKKYAAKMVFASPDVLADLLGKLAAFYDDVFNTEGAALCGRFAQDGSGVLFQLAKSDGYVERLDAQSAAFLTAVVSGIEAPENYGAPANEDYAMVLAAMVRMGAPQSYVASIAGGNGADPDLCPALAAMFRAASIYDAPEGLRMRAALAQNLAGY